MNKKGFTLAEILVTVMIVAMLAAMAVPMYEKAIEKSHLGEMRTVMAKMFDSKMRILDTLEKTTYSGSLFTMENLDINLPCVSGGGSYTYCRTKNFRYTLAPSGTSPVAGVNVVNGICAARCGGDNNNTAFLYLGSYVNDSNKSNIYCYGSKCSEYGFTQASPGSAWCSC